MARNEGKMTRENEQRAILERTRAALDLGHPFSRREFILITGSIAIGLSALEARGAKEPPLIIMD